MTRKAEPISEVRDATHLGCAVLDVEDFLTFGKQKTDGCAFCCKPLAREEWFCMFVAGGLSQIGNTDDEEQLSSDSSFMGAHPIGPDCARHLRAAIVRHGLNPDKFVFRMPTTTERA